MFQLVILVCTFQALEGAGCYNDGLWWTNDYLQGITLRVLTAPLCLDICQNTPGCVAYTWLSGQFVEQHFAETCLTYSDIGTPESCKDCISGVVADCQVCGRPVECAIGNNLIAEVPTSTEVGCKKICEYYTGCGYYTWFDGTTVLKNLCFLLTSCGETVECEGCSSGPPQCKTDYCEGMEYNLLDDPTRNEKHGK